MSHLRKQVKALEPNVKRGRKADYDPEDDELARSTNSDDNSESDASVDESKGREHYEQVGKSKLRKAEKSKLDERKYGGEVVSRSSLFSNDEDDAINALAPDEDEDEDPFAAKTADLSGSEDEQSEDNDEDDEDDSLEDGDLDGVDDSDQEIDSDEAFGEGEEAELRQKGFAFRGSGQRLSTLPQGSDEGEEASIEESDVSGDQSDTNMEDIEDSQDDDDDDDDVVSEDKGSDESEEDDESTARPRPSTLKPTAASSDREKLKYLIANDTAALASSISASQSADAKKGAAVKKQHQTFDRYLDARIKLQKALTASEDLILNTDPSSTETAEVEAQIAVQKAEQAALKLYATIESLRHSIIQDKLDNSTTTNSHPQQPSSKKRKRPSPTPAPTTTTPTSDLWTRLKSFEDEFLPNRRQILDKWSTKTRTVAGRPMTTSSSSTTTNKENKDPNLTSILDTYLFSESSKLLTLATTTTPNPNPNSTTTRQPSPPPLPSSLSLSYTDTNFYQSLLRDLISTRSSSTTSSINPTTSSLTLPPQILPTKLHQSGNKSQRDTKSSKGRKIRYTVHEKLENFMVGEGGGTTQKMWTDRATDEFFASLLGMRGVLYGEEEVEEGNGDDDREEEEREVEALRLFSR